MEFMNAAGYRTSFEDEGGDEVQPEAPSGAWMNHMNLVAAFEYMKCALKLENSTVHLVSPELLKAFMNLFLEGFDEGATPDELEVLKGTQMKRKEALQKALQQKAVVFVPVHHMGHWALLEVDGRFEGKPEMHWRDSLTPGETTAGLKTYIDAAVKELLEVEGVPDACNKALQPVGTAVCGCYVLHWMEQICRTKLLNEASCSIGWPDSAVWAGRVHKLVDMMQKEQGKLKKSEEASKMKAAADAAKKHAAADAKVAAAKKGKELEVLKEAAGVICSKVPAGKPCLENLSPAAQAAVHKASLGSGVCSKCHWQSGCLLCCREKALQYYLKKEGFVVDVMKYSSAK